METQSLVLAIGAMMFCALAQFVLSWVSFFRPNRGELPWPALVVTALSLIVLVVAARRDGVLLNTKHFVWCVAALCWAALFTMLFLSLQSPWELIHIPVWLNPSEDGYVIRRGVWRPLHVLHALGPIAFVLAASAREQPRPMRWRVVWAGVVPWLLGSALYAYLLTLPRPIYMG